MKKICLVGYSGFVGSNINKNGNFEYLYDHTNIENAFGLNPDLLIYSGVRAEKYLANQEPEKDMKIIEEAIENIKNINAKEVVLISSVDIYKSPNGQDEDSIIEEEGLHPYGYNRRQLEKWVIENIEKYHIIRLPALFGINIKKNFIYDILNPVPAMLTSEKYIELIDKDSYLKDKYTLLENGFYKLNVVSSHLLCDLEEHFRNLEFTSLKFTDSRAQYQFYNLNNLWNDIQKMINENIKVLNIATEPVSAKEIYSYIFDENFINEVNDNYPTYNLKSKYSGIWNCKDGYLYTRETILPELKGFVLNYKNKIRFSISNIAWGQDDDISMYKYLQTNGFIGLEIAPTRIFFENPYDNLDIANEWSSRLMKEYNLVISSMQSIWYGKMQSIFSNEEDRSNLIEYTKKAIDFADAINCRNIVFGCPKNRNINDINSDYEIALNFFRELGNYAKSKNIIISIEPNPKIYGTNFINTTKEAFEFIKAVAHPFIKINIDLGTIIENNENLSELANNFDLINHIHISEPNLELIQKRQIHEELFKLLKEKKYKNFVSIEMKNMKDINKIYEVIKYLKEYQ